MSSLRDLCSWQTKNVDGEEFCNLAAVGHMRVLAIHCVSLPCSQTEGLMLNYCFLMHVLPHLVSSI